MQSKPKQLPSEIEQALFDFRARGFTPVEAIKAIREVHKLSLANAKQALSASPAWARESAVADQLHAEFLGALAKEPKQ